VAPEGNGSLFLGRRVLAFAFILTVAACGSSTNKAASDHSTASSPTTAFRGTPSLTLPGLVAPPRSRKVVFTGTAADVEKAFRALLAGFNRKDVAAVHALQTKPTPRAQLLSFVNSYRVRLYRINRISVYGDEATIDYENAIVGRNLKSDATTTLLGQQDVWHKKNGRWKVVSDRAFTPGIPEDLRSVTVTLRDHAPTIVPARLPKTDFAFVLKNTGRATKGVFILGVPAHLKVSDAIAVIERVGAARDTSAGNQFPEGITEIGATADVAGHRNGTMVFSRRLSAGRYLLVSRAADSGHLLPNEVADFTIASNNSRLNLRP